MVMLQKNKEFYIEASPPRVVVVTVCYNSKVEIEKTLMSVVSQDYPNMEFIVVDGGSTDGTVGVIRDYEKSITRWVSERDNGIYDAMNKGICLIEGDEGWVIFMNSGDTFCDSNVVSRIFLSSVARDVGLIYGDVIFPTPWGKLLKNCEPREGEPEQLCHQCVFARLDLMKKLGFDVTYRIAADGRFFKAVKDLGFKFEHRAVFVANYDCFDGISSTQGFLVFKEYARIHNRRISFFHCCVRALRHVLKMFLCRLLPKRFNMYLRYRSLKRLKRISER